MALLPRDQCAVLSALLQAGEPATELPGGYGAALLQTLLALAVVCVLAWVVLKWASRRGFAFGAGGRRVKVLERVALDPRRTLYLVEVGGKVLLLGAGDGASPRLISELDPDALPDEPAKPKARFADVLGRLRGAGESDDERPAPDEP